jgi:hypothetical protein
MDSDSTGFVYQTHVSTSNWYCFMKDDMQGEHSNKPYQMTYTLLRIYLDSDAEHFLFDFILKHFGNRDKTFWMHLQFVLVVLWIMVVPNRYSW